MTYKQIFEYMLNQNQDLSDEFVPDILIQSKVESSDSVVTIEQEGEVKYTNLGWNGIPTFCIGVKE